MPHALGAIEQLKSSGSGNMQVPLRPGFRFALTYIRCHFRRTGGSGTDVATLTVDLDDDDGVDFDVRLLSAASAGVGSDVHIRVTDESEDQWTFGDTDGLTLSWTNPDPGEINWGLTVGIRRWQ